MNRTLRWWEWLLLLVAVGIFAAQLLIASPQKSAAFDEQYHLTAGYTYLRTGDFRLATTHPPLMGMVGALGLLGWEALALPLDHPAWQAGDRFLFSDVFLWEANPDPQGMLLAARRPIMAVGVVLMVALFFWACQLIGPVAGWVVLLLAIFDPNLLGNSRVVTTDLGLTCFLLLGVWRLWCWLERRTPSNLILAGLCAGLAMCAKFTGLLIWPTSGLILCIYPAMFAGDTLWRRWLGLISIGLVALGVTWAVYRFDFGPMTNGPIAWPLPAPFYWQQLYNTFFRIVDLQGARYDFFWGEASNAGWWNYFPIALAVKTPLPLLIMGLVGLIVAMRKEGWRRTSVLWALPLFFLGLGLSGVLTIGYRHILPVVPFFMMMAGYCAPLPLLQPIAYPSPVWRGIGVGKTGWRVYLILALLLWSITGSCHLFPHQEAFFNELAGDWYNWSNLLVDSNLDWGQDLPALRQRMDELGIATVNLAYFGKAVPEVYGVRYRPLYGYLRFVEGRELSAYNPYTPEPGWYAISATSLRLGLHQAESLDLYAHFRQRRPDARAGYSIYLYHLTDAADTPIERKVVVGEPLYQMKPDALGIEAGRRVQVKWVSEPKTTIFPLGEGFTLPASAAFHAVNANFGDVFTLLGYSQEPATPQRGQPLQLTLYWQVGATPMAFPAPTKGEPLSAFVHLTVPGDAGQKLAQFDGWSVALRGLEVNDVIVQPVQLEISPDATAGVYELLVGLYSPQSAARLLVTNQAGNPDYVIAGQLDLP